MKHGFIKIGCASPEVAVAAPQKNVCEINKSIDTAYAAGCAVLSLPSLCITGATCGDLFFTDTLLKNAEKALCDIASHTEGKKMLVFVSLPVRVGTKLYNCAAAISDGGILGFVPQSKAGLRGECYDVSIFSSPSFDGNNVRIGAEEYPLGTDLVFSCAEMPSLKVGCSALRNTSDTALLASSGATVIVCPDASAEIIGRADYRRTALKAESADNIAAIAYSNAGVGESTTDTVCSGHCIIADRGHITAEKAPFEDTDIITAVVDIAHLMHDRMKNGMESEDANEIEFSLDMRETDLSGAINRSPFVPSCAAEERIRCAEILEIQSRGLCKRITAAHAKGCVVALSGGLDSTLALIVTVHAMDILGRDRKGITSVTLPCFGTTSRTRSNAQSLAESFGTSFRCIDIKESVDLHFRDIGHDPDNHSVVYENSQARERTQIIMDIANADGSLVIGTGDLSELALGWATYNGDHMSNYGVNAGIPKTLIRRVVAYYASLSEENGNADIAAVLRDILDTPVSPELLPPTDGEIAQKTEDIVGPYDLHDFFLYHFVRWGEEPEKIYREACAAFAGEFDEKTIQKWLSTFMRRFFTQQFKRSALPDGPKVGAVSFSPRGDWRMPSDADGSGFAFNI